MPNISDTITKLKSFASLPQGWRFGEGGPISSDAITLGVNWVKYAESVGITRANAFAGPDLEIAVTFYRDDRSIEITLESDRSITFAEDCGDEQLTFVENLGLEQVINKIWAFQFPHQIFVEYSIRETTIPRAAGSLVSRSRTLPTAAGSPSLTSNVPIPKVEKSANTSQSITETKPWRQASSGGFPLKTFPKLA